MLSIPLESYLLVDTPEIRGIPSLQRPPMSDPDDDPDDALPFDDEAEASPSRPKPRAGAVSPRSLFERESDDRSPVTRESDPRRTVPRESPEPGPGRGVPVAAILLLVLLAAVAGYVLVRSLFSPGPPAQTAAVTPPPAQAPAPSAARDATREDYFDPLAPVGGADS